MNAKLSGLLQLFRDILPTRNMEEMEQRLVRAQDREYLSALAKIYYDMGVHCMKNNDRLSSLPGCEILGELGRATDLILQSFHEQIAEADFQFLLDTCNQLYELGDDECFSDLTKQVEIPGGAPIQAFDLNGLLVLTELNLYLDSHLRLLTEGPENSEADIDLVPCALLPDYYLRTCKEDLSLLPQIQQEIARIEDDFEFVRSKITWQDIAGRVAQYKELDILTCR